MGHNIQLISSASWILFHKETKPRRPSYKTHFQKHKYTMMYTSKCPYELKDTNTFPPFKPILGIRSSWRNDCWSTSGWLSLNLRLQQFEYLSVVRHYSYSKHLLWDEPYRIKLAHQGFKSSADFNCSCRQHRPRRFSSWQRKQILKREKSTTCFNMAQRRALKGRVRHKNNQPAHIFAWRSVPSTERHRFKHFFFTMDV